MQHGFTLTKKKTRAKLKKLLGMEQFNDMITERLRLLGSVKMMPMTVGLDAFYAIQPRNRSAYSAALRT